MKNVLLVGLGNIGMMYDYYLKGNQKILTHAKAFSLNNNFKIIGAIEKDPFKCGLFKERYNAPTFSDFHKVDESLKPDIVVISTPTKLHKEHISKSLKFKSLKIILCEKPISYSIEDAQFILDICKNRGIKLFVNYIRRTDPGVIEIKKRFKSNSISTPIKGFCWYSKGLIHNGSHFFDILNFWLGPLKSFKVLNVQKIYQDSEDADIDFLASFQKGNIIFQAFNDSAYQYYAIEIFSKEGILKYNSGGSDISFKKFFRENTSNDFCLSEEKELISNDMDNYQKNVVSNLYPLNKLTNLICTGDEALENLYHLKKVIETVCS